MSNSSSITSQTVLHIASLAKLTVTTDQVDALAQGFSETLNVVDTLSIIDTKNIEPLHVVTDTKNVWREDEVDAQRMFTQEQALANAPKKHNGYFVVEQVIDQDDA